MIPARPLRCGAFALSIAALAVGCARDARPTTPSAGPLPLVLLPVDALEGELSLRQHVTARYGEREESFDAVLEKREGVLRLVGLGPMATVAFTVTLSARGLEFDNRTGREVPFRPEYIVADIQRVFYPWLPADGCARCTRKGRVEGLEVTERVEGGRRIERRFRHQGAPEQGEVVVSYRGGWGADGRTPAQVRLTNGWYGYELILDTLDQGL